MSEVRPGQKMAADGFKARKPIYGDDALTEVFGTGRWSEAEGKVIRKLSAEQKIPCTQVIRKYFLRGLKPG